MVLKYRRDVSPQETTEETWKSMGPLNMLDNSGRAAMQVVVEREKKFGRPFVLRILPSEPGIILTRPNPQPS